MRRGLMALLLLAASLVVAGCGGGPSPAAAVTVTGKIVDIDRNPMTGATVRIESRSTVTDIGSYGVFSLTARPGQRTIEIAKSGFMPRSVSVNVTGPMDVGSITIYQDIPSWKGPFTDARVLVPTISGGAASFSVPTPSATAESWLMLFPRTSTEGNYTWSFSAGAAESMMSQVVRASLAEPHPGAGTVLRSTMRSPHRLDPRIDDRHRRLEVVAYRDRSQILGTRTSRVTRSLRTYRDSVGQTRKFFKRSMADGSLEPPVTATCKAVTTHAIFYVDNSSTAVTQSVVDDLANTFEGYYNTITGNFGTPLDIDQNGKLIILITPITAEFGYVCYGYFTPENYLPNNSSFPASNEADMIYINPVLSEMPSLKGTLAHEFQHLIHFSERALNGGDAIDDTWVTEAFATLAEDLAGYGYIQGAAVAVEHVNDWLTYHHNWSLTNWGSDNASYGGSYIFARHLYDHFGGSSVTLKVNRSAYGGTKAITDATGGTFEEVFASFAASIPFYYFHYDSPDSRLAFPSGLPGFNLDGDELYRYPVDATLGAAGFGQVRPWGLDFVWILGGAEGTSLQVNLSTEIAGNYGAVLVTGL